jgi:Skp family chaperone for outer membrane proteins
MRYGQLGLIVGLVVVVGGCAPRLAVVDSKRVLNESVLALSFQKQLDDREKAMVTDLRLLSSQLSKEDLDVRRQTYERELVALRQQLEGRLNERIRQATAEVARRRRLRIVLVKQITTRGGDVDVTDEVIARLK